jgi:bacterial/archaeal transporter family-2 protein
VAALGGASVALQSRINSALSVRLHDSVAAATISFGSGLILLASLVAATPYGRRGLAAVRAALHDGTLRPWQCLGGASGAFFVFTQGAAVGPLGLAVYTVALIAGQVASSLAVDRAGLGPGGAHPVSAARLAGAALALVAVVVAVADRFGSPDSLVLATLPALAGLGIAWQQAVTGRVRMAGGALLATFVNFGVGTAVLLVAFGLAAAVRGAPHTLPHEAWLYTGGCLGVVYIACAAAVVRLTGVLVLGLSMIAGQLTGAVLIDLVAPGRGGGLAVNTALGAAITLCAVAVAGLRRGGR